MGLRFLSGFNNSQQNGIFQLDIVGFLAILGEGSIETVQQVSHSLAESCSLSDVVSQVLTLSNLAYLPRLIPAPQVLLRVTRPNKLETVGEAKVVGVHSGTLLLSATTVEKYNLSEYNRKCRTPYPLYCPCISPG